MRQVGENGQPRERGKLRIRFFHFKTAWFMSYHSIGMPPVLNWKDHKRHSIFLLAVAGRTIFPRLPCWKEGGGV